MVATLAKLTVGGNSGEYYIEQVASGRHDYYAGHGEAPGVWAGKGAEALGLSGEVSPDAFRAVLACKDPATGRKLKRQANKVVLGVDVTFSAPKSVSVLYALGDEEVRAATTAAHEAGVAAGLEHLEAEACVARFGKNGVERQAGIGFIAAAFRHRTSRAGDPQLHSHAVMANVVQTADGRASAFDAGMSYRHCRAAGAVYDGMVRTVLSEQLGVVWEQRGGQWEVAAVDPQLCQLFSKRRREIQDCLDEGSSPRGVRRSSRRSTPARPRTMWATRKAWRRAGLGRPRSTGYTAGSPVRT
jgi:conjugative relaxase-like TrwC/TraI family protein